MISGGHSLGAVVSIIEAANYGDVDGVLVASIVHRLDPVDVTTRGLLAFHPAPWTRSWRTPATTRAT